MLGCLRSLFFLINRNINSVPVASFSQSLQKKKKQKFSIYFIVSDNFLPILTGIGTELLIQVQSVISEANGI